MITINNPQEIESLRVRQEIVQMMNNGVRSREIELYIDFFAPEEVVSKISHRFQVIKNHAYFLRDSRSAQSSAK